MSAIFQTSYSQRRSEGFLGQFFEGAMAPREGTTKIARGKVKAGYGVFRSQATGTAGYNSPDPGECFMLPTPGIGADADAIIATGGSTAGVQTLSGASLDGVIGGGLMAPARKLELVLSSHADWDATNATVSGLDAYGRAQTETIAIPNGGNTTVNGTKYWSKVTSLSIPAQSGTGGTFTLGVQAMSALGLSSLLGVACRQPIKPTVTAAGIYGYPGDATPLVEADYVDGESVPVLTHGGIWVYAEAAVNDGDPVYVRTSAGSYSVLGAFRADDDSSSCTLVTGAKFRRDSSGAGPAVAHFVNL